MSLTFFPRIRMAFSQMQYVNNFEAARERMIYFSNIIAITRVRNATNSGDTCRLLS